MKKSLVLIAIVLSVFACGNSEKSNSDKIQDGSDKSRAQSPCELLSETEIKNTLSIPTETETSMKEKNTTFPTCFYKWESITWPYEVMNGHMANYAAEMSIVQVSNIKEAQYKSSVSYYKDGESVDDIGDMATWSTKKTQLTFLYKGNLIHVHARTSADADSNKTQTLALAKLIIDKL
ncbi:hypothetical protein [Gelidibacter maritimus]|uniref:DUF3558 domain-containing protein n=1 Tax=Gelidibacter maritimus TaxID=2761487 RepID=A0A7W2M3X1_9FLAO|nr:hypothetical protein [Gelidibacter maritimus]MBA6152016.1 hypothetical protein [Gelidibacter maritimus]